jgi:syntaxin-binding protein 1
MDAVNNMVFLGANVTKDSGKRKKALFKQPLDENAYDISRFQPVVKLMLQV